MELDDQPEGIGGPEGLLGSEGMGDPEGTGAPDAPFDAVDKVQAAATSEFFTELLSPLNLVLLTICAFLLYQIIKSRRGAGGSQGGPPPLVPLKKRDFTLVQLRPYNGTQDGGRILVAVNGKVFDVTKGKNYYGPGGPYGVFAGRDASRGLGTFSLTDDTIRDTWDDLSDLKSDQMERIREWEIQFTEKYDVVGRLLKEGEEPADYSDTEEEGGGHALPDRSKSD